MVVNPRDGSRHTGVRDRLKWTKSVIACSGVQVITDFAYIIVEKAVIVTGFGA